jgi:hypothetical protein
MGRGFPQMILCLLVFSKVGGSGSKEGSMPHITGSYHGSCEAAAGRSIVGQVPRDRAAR